MYGWCRISRHAPMQQGVRSLLVILVASLLMMVVGNHFALLHQMEIPGGTPPRHLYLPCSQNSALALFVQEILSPVLA